MLVLGPAKPPGARRLAAAGGEGGGGPLQGLELCRATGDVDCVVRLAAQLASSLAGSLTCAQRGGMLDALTEAAAQTRMNRAEVAGFSEAVRSLSALPCADGAAAGGRRLASGGDLAASLALAGTLTSASLEAGLDPVATRGIGGSLSSALSAIAEKNAARRALAALLGRGGGAAAPPAFARRLPPGPAAAGARARAGAGDLSGALLDAVAGLAASQVHGAVTGEDAAGLETDAIRMSAQRVWPGALSGGTLAPPAADGAAVPAFALPASGLGGLGSLGGGGDSGLSVQVTGAGARPAPKSPTSPPPSAHGYENPVETSLALFRIL